MSLSEIIGLTAAIIYGTAMGLLAIQGLHLFWMLGRFLRHRRSALATEAAEVDGPLPPDAELPHVLVQLPVFNERDVVSRLVEAVGKLDWPTDRLHIQLLDDSTDDSVAIGEAAIAKLQEQGLQATSLHRIDRTGYKAGALDAGLNADDSPFVAIFDADFVPQPDFLRRAMAPLLADEGLALVQGRWEHLNPNENSVTRAQGIGIDGHFGIEQGARAWSGLAMNFNGTGGVWRRQAIIDGGGWEHDTLTEDMDLSYRVQLAGWRCTYRVGLTIPGELPPTIEAFRSQQFRWAKGSIQTAIKLLPRIWASPWSLARKVAATMHMTHYTVHPLMLMAMVFAPIAQWLAPELPGWFWACLGIFFLLGAGAPIATYVIGQLTLRPGAHNWALFWRIPRLAALGTGIAFTNAHAWWEAIRGRVSAFVRTPKGGAASSYKAGGGTGLPELLAGAWATTGILVGMDRAQPWITPLLLVYASGFTWVGLLCLRGWIARLKARAADEARESGANARRRLHGWLIGLGLASVAGYAILAHRPETWREEPALFAAVALALGAIWLAACFLVKRLPGGVVATALIILFAILFRVGALGVAASDDVNRYLVEGRQIDQWQNPYSHAPDDPSTQALLDEDGFPQGILSGVNHPDWTASYPPLAMATHHLTAAAWVDPWAFKILGLVAELITIPLVLALLRRWNLPDQLLLLYAWSPLGPLFAAGEGHHDPIMMLLLVAGMLALAGGARRRGMLALCGAALVKPFAVWALLPRLWQSPLRTWIACALVAIIAYLPFADAGAGLFASFGRFGHDKHFNAALEPMVRLLYEGWMPWHLLRSAVVITLVTLLIAASVAIVIRAQRKDRLDHPETTAALLVMLLLCLPTLHAWYPMLLLPLLPFTRSWGLLLWVALAPGYWLHGLAIQSNAGAWAEDPLVRTAIHLPALLLLAWEVSGRPTPPLPWRRAVPSQEATA